MGRNGDYHLTIAAAHTFTKFEPHHVKPGMEKFVATLPRGSVAAGQVVPAHNTARRISTDSYSSGGETFMLRTGLLDDFVTEEPGSTGNLSFSSPTLDSSAPQRSISPIDARASPGASRVPSGGPGRGLASPSSQTPPDASPAPQEQLPYDAGQRSPAQLSPYSTLSVNRRGGKDETPVPKVLPAGGATRTGSAGDNVKPRMMSQIKDNQQFQSYQPRRSQQAQPQAPLLIGGIRREASASSTATSAISAISSPMISSTTTPRSRVEIVQTPTVGTDELHKQLLAQEVTIRSASPIVGRCRLGLVSYGRRDVVSVWFLTF